MDWRHIDIDKRILHIEQAMKATTREIGEPKSDVGIRDIPIHDALLHDLHAKRRGPFEPVFFQPTTGQRHMKSSIQRFWNNFARTMDIASGATLYRNKIIVSTLAPDLVPY